MRALHANFGYVVVAANLVVGLWGIILWRRNQTVGRSFWIALACAWITIYVQGILGLAIFGRPVRAEFRHHFYGYLFAIITMAVFPIRGENPRRTLIVFSAATLFIGIVAVRAMVSG